MLILLIASGLVNLICLYHVLSSDLKSDVSGVRHQLISLSNKHDSLVREHQFMQTKIETCFALSEKSISMPKKFSVTIRRARRKLMPSGEKVIADSKIGTFPGGVQASTKPVGVWS